MRMSWWSTRLVVCLALLTMATPAFAQKVYINLGTVAPEGSVWHEILLEVRQEWERISSGRVVLRIYPSGVQGDEMEMLRKVNIGQLQAVALSGAGLSRIDGSVAALHIPMLIESYEELDYLRKHLTPEIESRLRERGFVTLNWGEVGWVYFFTKTPAKRLSEIREMRLFTAAGDPETEKLYKEFGFQPIPLAVTDLLPSLQTGMVDAMDVPPLFALLEQTFALAPHMTPVRWAPLTAATVVSEKAWLRVPEEWRAEMLEAAERAAHARRDEIRRMGQEAVLEMQKRGLEVVEIGDGDLDDWIREAEAAYPRIRGTLVPEDLFDEALRLKSELRDGKGANTDETHGVGQ